MSRVLPHPKLFLALLAMWLLMNQSLSPGQFLLGALVAFGGSWAMVALDPPVVRIRGLRAICILAWRVFIDVFKSNLAVARIILREHHGDRDAGFMTVRLDIRNQYALAVLSIVLTCTPGTLWVNYNSSTGELLLHVLDLVDEEEWIQLIKGRYESLLMEIFQ
jgi:multicomponent K+:H+ antiporter subunit E